MKKWKSRVPKNRRNEGVEAAIKCILYPTVVAGVLLFGKTKKTKRRRK